MELDTSQLDIKQLFFNNLQLLGFDASAMEAANHIPFNRTMFELPNKRGSEIVLHYLFQRLNPVMCREAFRDCWPIFDKKREQAFRKACSTWLTNISQDEPDSHLPRINASLFMSPGGEKFYQLLFHFSGYVLQKVLESELGSESCDRLRYPVLNAQNLPVQHVMNKIVASAAIRQRTRYFNTVQLNVKAYKSWKDSADEHVREYRRLNKEIRECEYRVRDEEQRAVEASLARGSPVKKRGQGEQFDPEFDPRTIKRAQRLQQVREMWKQLEDYDRGTAPERDVVESIVERTVNKYTLDGDDISVKVPDMLLRECGEEIRRRNVDNTYQGGKLNLLSVLQLWNLSLHLYKDKLSQVGMPRYTEEVQKLTSQVHVQQNYTQKAQTLRQQMAERIPVLKESVAKLREKLDSALLKDMSPESIRTTSVGLGLVGPSPQVSFSPGQGKTPEGGIGVPKPSDKYMDTPEAANQFTEQVKQAVRRGPEQLFRQPDLLKQGNRPEEPSSIPRPARSQVSSRASSRPTSARSSASSKASVKSTPKSSRSAHRAETIRKEEKSFTKVTSPRTLMERLQLGHSLRQEADGQETETRVSTAQPVSARSDRSDVSSSRTLSARSEQSLGSDKENKSGAYVPNGTEDTGASRKTAADLLVEEIMGEGQILSPFNSGMEAFETHNLVKRTPDAAVRDSLTPTNDMNTETVNEDIVDIHSAEVDLDKYTEQDHYNTNTMSPVNESLHTSDQLNSSLNHLETSRTDTRYTRDQLLQDHRDSLLKKHTDQLLEEGRDQYLRGGEKNEEREDVELSETKKGYSRDEELNECQDQFDEDTQFSINGQVRTLERRDTDGSRDDDVEGMIEEGIRQVHEEELEEEKESQEQNNSSLLYQPEEEDLQFEDVLGPEIEDLGDDGSQRSTEEPIVIDKSLHMSPEHAERSHREISSPVSPEVLLDEEKFPSLENSPREAIVIDRSFRSSVPRGDTSQVPVSLSHSYSRDTSRLTGSPSTGTQRKEGATTRKQSDMLSQSLPGRPSPGRSPLSDEIRKMFQKALEDTPLSRQVRGTPPRRQVRDTPPRRHVKGSPKAHTKPDDDSSPDYPGPILQQSDISWDLTENLDDIQLPNLSGNMDDDNSVDDNIDDLLNTEDRIPTLESVNVDDLLNDERNMQIPDLKDDDIDDFFKSKTPELPKRRVLASACTSSRSQNDGQLERSLEEGSSMDLPKFPQGSSKEDESPLISFTP